MKDQKTIIPLIWQINNSQSIDRTHPPQLTAVGESCFLNTDKTKGTEVYDIFYILENLDSCYGNGCQENIDNKGSLIQNISEEMNELWIIMIFVYVNGTTEIVLLIANAVQGHAGYYGIATSPGERIVRSIKKRQQKM